MASLGGIGPGTAGRFYKCKSLSIWRQNRFLGALYNRIVYAEKLTWSIED